MNNDISNLLSSEGFDRVVGNELSVLGGGMDINSIFERGKSLLTNMVDFKELMMMYNCATKEVRTKFDVLNTEYSVRYQRNPISSITTRLKTTTSIMEKLARKGFDISTKNIEESINDIAGVRVICSYVDDIYRLADSLTSQDDITLLRRKDYIANPKPNGYRSLHLIVSVPVFFAEQTKKMKVEVQIRTIAMDFWATLEHQMKYKKEIPEQADIVNELRNCADVIARTDEEMLAIRNRIEASASAPTEEDILFEKLMKFDNPIL